MHRLRDQVISYFADLATTSVRSWRGFFFSAASPSRLGLIRIVVGSLMVWNLLTLGPDLHDYLGSDGWISPEADREYLATASPWAWSFWLYVPDAWLRPVWLACVAIAALFALGLASRATAVLIWAVAVSTARRAPVTMFGFDQMNATWILYLAAFGASGQALSLDRLLARRRREPARSWRSLVFEGGPPPPTVSANLTLRLIQIHLAIVYGSAGLSKLMGAEWWNGTALQMILLTPEFRRLDPSWLLARPWLLQFATHAGLALEIAYPVLIWVRPLRPLVLASVVAMHFGIDLMLGLTEFGLSMVAANLAFLPSSIPQPAPALVEPPRRKADREIRRSEPAAAAPT